MTARRDKSLVVLSFLSATLLLCASGQTPAPKTNPDPSEKSAKSKKVAPKKNAESKKPAVTARQVTLFGILADPSGAAMDPKLENASAQLRKLFPDHSFKLIEVKTRRLKMGDSIQCDLGDGFVAEAKLTKPLDADGKVRLRVALSLDGMAQIATDVVTPPNQLLFCDKKLPNGTRLLIGVGAR